MWAGACLAERVCAYVHACAYMGGRACTCTCASHREKGGWGTATILYPQPLNSLSVPGVAREPPSHIREDSQIQHISRPLQPLNSTRC